MNKILRATIADLKRQVEWITWMLAPLLRARYSLPKPPSAPPAPSMTETMPIAPQPSAAEHVYEIAKAYIGYDLSKYAENEKGCAEAVSRILGQVYPNFPILTFTGDLNVFLKYDPRFKAVLHPKLGCVSIFPTTFRAVGHVGIWGKTHVISNTSATGKLEANYTHAEWYAEADKRKLPIFHYLPS